MMVPSSVEKRAEAGALLLPSLITKSEVGLSTCPVGVPVLPAGLPPGGGMTMGAPRAVPSGANKAALPPLLSEIRNSPRDETVKPQGLTKAESVCGATRPC